MSIQAYRLDIYNVLGEQVAEIVNPLSVQIEHRLDWFSTHTISLPRYDNIQDLFPLDAIIEVYRKLSGEWYFEYGGFHRTPQRVIQANDEKVFWSYGRNYNDLLHRRTIMYPSDRVSGKTLKSGPAETVMKQFVSENATADAISPPRGRSGKFTGLTLNIEGDQARGPNWAGQRSNKKLLDVLQEIATVSGVDFAIRRVGPTEFEFHCGYPQLGSDLTATTQFNPLVGNMVAPSYTFSRTEEANVIMVLGQGTGTARFNLVVTSGAQFDSPWNDIEEIVDARSESTFAGITQAGKDALAERAAKESFQFQAVQTDSLQYGRDYKVGDAVLAVFDDIVRPKKVIGCRLTLTENGEETVAPDFSDLPVV